MKQNKNCKIVSKVVCLTFLTKQIKILIINYLETEDKQQEYFKKVHILLLKIV